MKWGSATPIGYDLVDYLKENRSPATLLKILRGLMP